MGFGGCEGFRRPAKLLPCSVVGFCAEANVLTEWERDTASLVEGSHV